MRKTMKTYNVEILIAIPIVLVVLVGPALLLIGCFGSKNSQRKRQKFRDPAESSGTILRIWKTTDYQPEGPYYEPWVVKYSYYAGGILYEKSFQTNNRKVAHSLQYFLCVAGQWRKKGSGDEREMYGNTFGSRSRQPDAGSEKRCGKAVHADFGKTAYLVYFADI